MPSRLGQMGRKLGEWIPPEVLRPLGRPSAVFFHGVEPDTADPRVQVNHHEADVFRAIALELKTYFDVLPLSALEDALARPERHRRTVFLMSDDGYANTLGVAAPILEDLGLPWTLFVSTEHIGTGLRNPAFLALLFYHYMPPGRYAVPHLPEQVLGGPETRDVLARTGIGALKNLDMARGREAIDGIAWHLEGAGLSQLVEQFESEDFLDWTEVKALAGRGVEIGAHAHWHWPMNAAQTRAQLREQAQDSKARIEAEIGPCRAFAYPFGNTGDVCGEAWRAVRDAGYDFAFTTVSGALHGSANRFLLPRYGIGPSETHLASLIPLLSAGNARLSRWQRALTA